MRPPTLRFPTVEDERPVPTLADTNEISTR
jgi:hypothetical protein